MAEVDRRTPTVETVLQSADDTGYPQPNGHTHTGHTKDVTNGDIQDGTTTGQANGNTQSGITTGQANGRALSRASTIPVNGAATAPAQQQQNVLRRSSLSQVINALSPNGGNQQLDDIELVDLSVVEKEKRPCRVKVPVDLSWLV